MRLCDGINCQLRHDVVVKDCGERVPVHGNGQCWHVSAGSRNYAAAIKLAHHDFIDEVIETAHRMKRDLIIPFCDRHQVRFLSGMGTYVFEKLDGSQTHYNWEMQHYTSDHRPGQVHVDPENAPEGYDAVFAALHIDVPDNSFLFMYIGDYDPSAKEVDDGDVEDAAVPEATPGA